MFQIYFMIVSILNDSFCVLMMDLELIPNDSVLELISNRRRKHFNEFDFFENKLFYIFVLL